MCGIAGFAAAPGRSVPSRELLERMTASLAHRGPELSIDAFRPPGAQLGLFG